MLNHVLVTTNSEPYRWLLGAVDDEETKEPVVLKKFDEGKQGKGAKRKNCKGNY